MTGFVRRRIAVPGSREARRVGADSLQPVHVLAAAIADEDSALAARIRQLWSGPLEPVAAAEATPVPSHIAASPATHDLVAFAAGWATARGSEEPSLQDLLVAAAWGPGGDVLAEAGDEPDLGIDRETVVRELRELGLLLPSTPCSERPPVWPVVRVASEADADRLTTRLEAEGVPCAATPSQGTDGFEVHAPDLTVVERAAAEVGVELAPEGPRGRGRGSG